MSVVCRTVWIRKCLGDEVVYGDIKVCLQVQYSFYFRNEVICYYLRITVVYTE